MLKDWMDMCLVKEWLTTNISLHYSKVWPNVNAFFLQNMLAKRMDSHLGWMLNRKTWKKCVNYPHFCCKSQQQPLRVCMCVWFSSSFFFYLYRQCERREQKNYANKTWEWAHKYCVPDRNHNGETKIWAFFFFLLSLLFKLFLESAVHYQQSATFKPGNQLNKWQMKAIIMVVMDHSLILTVMSFQCYLHSYSHKLISTLPNLMLVNKT